MEGNDLTREILAACFEVSNELGAGFLESVYEMALLIALHQKGLDAVAQHPIDVWFRSQKVGGFFADILVENQIIVELKAARALAPEHLAQTINYLNASRLETALLVNFGKPRIEYRRFNRNNGPLVEAPCEQFLNRHVELG